MNKKFIFISVLFILLIGMAYTLSMRKSDKPFHTQNLLDSSNIEKSDILGLWCSDNGTIIGLVGNTNQGVFIYLDDQFEEIVYDGEYYYLTNSLNQGLMVNKDGTLSKIKPPINYQKIEMSFNEVEVDANKRIRYYYYTTVCLDSNTIDHLPYSKDMMMLSEEIFEINAYSLIQLVRVCSYFEAE